MCLKTLGVDKQAEGTARTGSTHLGARDFLATIPGSHGSGEAGKGEKSVRKRAYFSSMAASH